MDVVKQYWIWIACGVVLLVLAGIQFTVTSGFETEAQKSERLLITRLKQLDSAARQKLSGNIPTAGDIEQAQKHLDAIRKEGSKTTTVWRSASAGMNRKHGKHPTHEFSLYLYQECDRSAVTLTESLLPDLMRMSPAIYNVKPDEAEETLKKRAQELVKEEKLRLCDMNYHQLSDLRGERYQTVEDTLPIWNRYLILERLHRLAAGIRVPVKANRIALKEAEGEERDADEYTFTLGEQVRVVERLSEVEWGEVELASLRAATDSESSEGMSDPYADENAAQDLSKGNQPVESSLASHDRYPVTFTVVAHTAVIQQLMTRLLQDGASKAKNAMLFVPRKAEISRFSDKEIASAKVSAIGSAAASQKSRGNATDTWSQLPLDLELRHDHEPPVKAVLHYDVYHFRFDAEKDGAATGEQ